MSALGDIQAGVNFGTTNLIQSAAKLQANPNLVAFAVRNNPAIGAAYDVYDDAVATLVVEQQQQGPSPSGGLTINSGVVYATDKFLVTSTVEAPKSRFVPTFSFGAPSVYTAGSDTTMLQISGHTLINREDGDGHNALYEAWQQYLRAGAQLIGSKRRADPWLVQFEYRDMIRRGYLIAMNQAVNAAVPAQGELALSMFVIESIDKK